MRHSPPLIFLHCSSLYKYDIPQPHLINHSSPPPPTAARPQFFFIYTRPLLIWTGISPPRERRVELSSKAAKRKPQHTTRETTVMELCMDEKWKLSKKGSRNGNVSRSSSCRRAEDFLKRSGSTAKGGVSCSSFTRRCAALVKEQRARFYIVRRCVTMLVCWREYSDC